MNYKKSQLILDEIKKANKILLNCHRSPDPDSVGSALSVFQILKQLGKDDVTIISPDDIPQNCKFLPNSELIQKTDFDIFDFSAYDTFIITDSGNWSQITGKDRILSSKIKTIVLDHHYTNINYGDFNIVDKSVGSACEVIYKLISDFGLKINKELAETILTGIIADTISFQTDLIGESAFSYADILIKAGADRNKIIFNLYKSRPFDEIQLMGKILSKSRIEKEYRFVWSAISKEETKGYPDSQDAKTSVVSSYMQSVRGTDFGFVLEEKEGFSSVSFRSRTDFDVSKIAEELGGGGHKSAAAARLIKISFDEAVEKVLSVCRKYAKKS
jgi:phosphoesterase RecJ-like protein